MLYSVDHACFHAGWASLQLLWCSLGTQRCCPALLLCFNAAQALIILWFSSKGPRFTKSDLNLLQLIKAGKEGVFYQARMTRGTCKGHNMFTCKISKEGAYFTHCTDKGWPAEAEVIAFVEWRGRAKKNQQSVQLQEWLKVLVPFQTPPKKSEISWNWQM